MATKMQAVAPLPTKPEWAPSYLAARAGAVNRDFAFGFRDAEGAPGSDGHRYHSAVDWHAPAGAVVVAPRAGTVTRAYTTSDVWGPVYGGVVEITEPNGTVWVMRHVVPSAPLGRAVAAGDPVARVSEWASGGPHLHMEIWRGKAGGYRHENMLDPASVEWTEAAPQVAPADVYFEELPHSHGGNGPRIVGQAKGYARPELAKAVATFLRATGRIVSTVRGEDDRTYVLTWKPGTYGHRYRFGPWGDAEAAKAVRVERAKATGRAMRPFIGRHRSLYPWPK